MKKKKKILYLGRGGGGGPGGRQTQGYQIFRAVRPHHRADKCITRNNKATRSPEISREQVQKLTPQFLLYIYWLYIPTVPNLLSGETTFQLTSC